MTDTIEAVAQGWAESIAQHLCHPADQDAAIRLIADALARFERDRIASHTKALIEGAGEVSEECAALAVQIDPLLLGGPDARLLNQAAATIAALRAENFMLAAGACINPGDGGLVGDEHGNSVCTVYEDKLKLDAEVTDLMAKLAEARAENERAKEEGVSAGIEAAARVCEAVESPFDEHAQAPENCAFYEGAEMCEQAIRALAPAAIAKGV